jgi:ABC-type nickel/cobalt efflux system permease component RcnA
MRNSITFKLIAAIVIISAAIVIISIILAGINAGCYLIGLPSTIAFSCGICLMALSIVLPAEVLIKWILKYFKNKNNK